MKLKDIRIKNNYKSYEIANLLELSNSAYSDKERGKRKFTPNEIYKICEHFSLNILDIDDFKAKNKE